MAQGEKGVKWRARPPPQEIIFLCVVLAVICYIIAALALARAVPEAPLRLPEFRSRHKYSKASSAIFCIFTWTRITQVQSSQELGLFFASWTYRS